MGQGSNRDKVRAQIAEGGWQIAWGKLITEVEVIVLIVTIPSGSAGAWVYAELQAQAVKFGKSFADISPGLVSQAIAYLQGLLDGRRAGEWQFGNIGVKAGFATYKRWGEVNWGPLGKHKTDLPNHHQPYIGVRLIIPEPPPPPAVPFQLFNLHTGTVLHETDATFSFALTDWNGDGFQDLVAIKKTNTGTRSTEVHIFSGATSFNTALLQTGTALHETDHTWAFALTDWNGDGRADLVAIGRNNTGSKTTEVHILSGASNFQEWILHTSTALHETDATFDFSMADWNGDGKPDLVAFKKSGTGTKTTEVHILSGASTFQKFILHTGTGLHETDAQWTLATTDWNGDGKPDLVCIKRVGQDSTEVGILSGASNFQTFFFNVGTALHKTDSTFDFAIADWNRNGRPDVVAIKKSGTGTDSTEVHVLAG